MTRVLPLPAPARISSGPSKWVTASRWAGVRSASRSGGDCPGPGGIVNSPGAGAGYTIVSAAGRAGHPANLGRSAPGGQSMDILGIGTDIVECLRIRRMIERHGELFLTRVFTE